MQGRIFNIQRFSIHDGDGIRTAVFFKGCNLRCSWCHNPESQKRQKQIMYYKSKCTGCGACRSFCNKLFTNKCTSCGECVKICKSGARKLCGFDISEEELLCEIEKDKKFYGAGGGVTFSGGEPMLQPEFLAEIAGKCKAEGISTAIETAGNVPWTDFCTVLPHIDCVLYDIKSLDSENHKIATGVSNELILENARRLLELDCNVVFRMPVIPGFNDDEVLAVSEFARSKSLELLAFHSICSSKYEALGLNFKMSGAEPTTAEYMESLAALGKNIIYNADGI